MKKSGSTPHGGDYSEIYFLDSNNNYVENKDDAVRAVIRECKDDGTLIFETWLEVQ